MLKVLEALTRVEVAGVQQAAGLQVFGLKWPAGNGLDYATLDEALQEQVLDVTEIDEGGRVPAIKVVNKSDRMVFLMAGEELLGGKQNRVLSASMMVPAKGEMPIPVTCVERGRWGYRSRRFRSGHSSSHSRLRMMMHMQVTAHYKARGVPGSDQGAVWEEVARKMRAMGSRSRSDALHETFEDRAHELEEALGSLPAPDGCNGAAFAIGGKIVGADLFDKPATLRKLWSKLIKSYAMDAFEDSEEKAKPVQAERIAEWLRAASTARQHWFDSPGIGKDVRIESQHLVGATLVIEEHPVHLELFPEQAPPEHEA